MGSPVWLRYYSLKALFQVALHATCPFSVPGGVLVIRETPQWDLAIIYPVTLDACVLHVCTVSLGAHIYSSRSWPCETQAELESEPAPGQSFVHLAGRGGAQERRGTTASQNQHGPLLAFSGFRLHSHKMVIAVVSVLQNYSMNKSVNVCKSIHHRGDVQYIGV